MAEENIKQALFHVPIVKKKKKKVHTLTYMKNHLQC